MSVYRHGKRESSTLVIYLKDEDNPAKAGIILDSSKESDDFLLKVPAL